MSDHSEEPIVVLMTAANREEAKRIAEALIETRLAACVQLLPEIESVYRWQGKINCDLEVLLLAKTTRAHFSDLDRKVREVHSYETPEIIALEIVEISEAYRKWLVDCLA